MIPFKPMLTLYKAPEIKPAVKYSYKEDFPLYTEIMEVVKSATRQPHLKPPLAKLTTHCSDLKLKSSLKPPLTVEQCSLTLVPGIVNITWSTMPVSELRRNVEASRFVNLLVVPSNSSSFSGKVIVLPITTSSPDTRIPGAMMPSSSNLS
uniref:Uncharacterized protein n=1 Tax=Glossina palpalis gambiensis TaxID=67801 RepID=A0A1B0B2Q9_9MUSC